MIKPLKDLKWLTEDEYFACHGKLFQEFTPLYEKQFCPSACSMGNVGNSKPFIKMWNDIDTERQHVNYTLINGIYIYSLSSFCQIKQSVELTIISIDLLRHKFDSVQGYYILQIVYTIFYIRNKLSPFSLDVS